MLIRFWRDDRAATTIEYCLIAGLIALAIVAGARTLGTKLSTKSYAPVATGLS